MIHKYVTLRLLHLSRDATPWLPREQSGCRNDGPGFLLVYSYAFVFFSCLTECFIGGIVLNSSMDLENFLHLWKYCLIRQAFLFHILSREFFRDRINNLQSLLLEAQCCLQLYVFCIWCHMFNSHEGGENEGLKSILQLPAWFPIKDLNCNVKGNRWWEVKLSSWFTKTLFFLFMI